MARHRNGLGSYEVIPTPAAVIFFDDKVVVIESNGGIIERGLEDQNALPDIAREPAFDDDFQSGDS